MRKGIFERAYLNWHYRKDILMKDISERAFPKGHFDEGHFEGRAFPKGERAKGMKGIVHKLEFPHCVGQNPTAFAFCRIKFMKSREPGIPFAV